MKKTKLLSLVIAIILLTTICFIGTKSYATETDEAAQILTTGVSNGEENTVEGVEEHEHSSEEGQLEETPDIHEGDLYVFFGEEEKTATKYVMDKMVDGNVFIFANEVEITGQVNGSVYVFASKLTVDEKAYIAMDLYAFAQDITMSGYAFDVYAAGTNFDLTKTGVAYRDLKLFTNNAHLIGAVGRDVDLGATNITVYDDEENNFFVGNNFNYSSEKEIEHIGDITVRGEVKFNKEEAEEVEETNKIGSYVVDAIGEIVFTVAIYAALLFLAPKFVEKSKEYVSTRGLLAAAVGLAFTLLVPIVAVILLFTVVGISIAFTMAFIYGAVLMINNAIVVIAISQFICNKSDKLNTTWKKLLMIIPVTLVLFLIKLIPFVGDIAGIVVFFVGVGIVTLYQFDRRRKQKEINE